MTTIPERDFKGNLTCPRCTTVLENGRAPLVIHGEYVGRYEALVCPICHYSAFTSKGIQKGMEDARQIGLIGPPEQREIIRESEQLLVIPENVSTINNIVAGIFKDFPEQREQLTTRVHELTTGTIIGQRVIRPLRETYDITIAQP